MTKRGVIIVAGGRGERMLSTLPKQFMLIDGEEVLLRSVKVFMDAVEGVRIVVALPETYVDMWHDIARREGITDRCVVCIGGKSRAESVRNGLAAMGEPTETIAVHDGVRPLVSAGMINRLYEEAEKNGTAIPVATPVDSFRIADDFGRLGVIDRSKLRAIQTPQIFRADILRGAYAADDISAFLDDASLVEYCGTELHFVEGEPENIKITRPADIIVAEALLKLRAHKQ